MAGAAIGTSGWSHPDWVGPFYPVHKRDAPETWLAHYATRFRTVEITSTFDRFPDHDLVEEWSRQGVALAERSGFEFSLKLPRTVTHEALPAHDVVAAREWAGRFDREVLDPLAGEGLLGAVLVQLPPWLDATPRRAQALMEALAPLEERSIALEIRNPTWIRNGCVIPALDRLFLSRDTCLVDADIPGGADARAPVGSRHAYLRFHGRRSEAWRPDQPHDGARYDHLYTRAELMPALERLAEHERAGRETRVYFRNTPRAQAVANAIDLMELASDDGAPPRPRLTAQKQLPL